MAGACKDYVSSRYRLLYQLHVLISTFLPMSLEGNLAADNACIWHPMKPRLQNAAYKAACSKSCLLRLSMSHEVPTQLSLNGLLSAVRGLSSNAEPGALSGIR